MPTKIKATTLAVVVSVLAPLTSYGADTDADCASFGKIAESVMKARQAGTPMSDALAIVEKTYTTSSPDARKLARAVVIDAYEVPHYTTEEMQERAGRDFRNTMELKCVKAMPEDE